MSYSMKELKLIAPSNKPQFLQWSGCKGIYYRLAFDGRSKKESRIWYWRGSLKRKGLKSDPKWVPLGEASHHSMTATLLQDEAERLRQMCKNGIDPQLKTVDQKPESLAPTTPTCDAAWVTYLDLKVTNRDINEDTKADYSGKYTRSISPFIGKLTVDAVTTAGIEQIYQHYAGKVQTQHHLDRILKPFFIWCRRQWKTVDPDLMDHKLPRARPAQERLMEGEIRRFGDALRHCDFTQKYNILFLLLTGSRAAVLTQWNPAWMESEWIAIPEGVRFLKDARKILLTPPVKALLPLLTPCSNSALRNCCIIVCKKAKTSVISSHDLRRTYISFGEDIGHPREVMLRLTNHAPKDQISSIYSKPELMKRMPIAIDVAHHFMELLGDQGLTIDWRQGKTKVSATTKQFYG